MRVYKYIDTARVDQSNEKDDWAMYINGTQTETSVLNPQAYTT